MKISKSRLKEIVKEVMVEENEYQARRSRYGYLRDGDSRLLFPLRFELDLQGSRHP